MKHGSHGSMYGRKGISGAYKGLKKAKATGKKATRKRKMKSASGHSY